MRLAYGGTTWDLVGYEVPQEPLKRDPIQAGAAARGNTGTLRTYIAYTRYGFDLAWTGLVTSGTSMARLRQLGTWMGTVTLSDTVVGTYECYVQPGSFQEKTCGWATSDATLRLEWR